MQIPFVGFQPVQSSEHLAAFGVFGLCQLYSLNQYLESNLTKESYEQLFNALVLLSGGVVGAAVAVLTITGSKSSRGNVTFANLNSHCQQKYLHGLDVSTPFSTLRTPRTTFP